MSNRIRIFSTLLLLFALTPNGAFSQTIEKDKEDVLKLVQRFSMRILQTQDIGLLLKEFFVEDLIQNSFKANRRGVFDFVKPDLWPKLDRDLQHKYYVAASNWSYLATMYNCTTAAGKEPELKTFLPSDV